MDIGQDKNNKLNKELSTSDEILMNQRIFNFYYYVLRKKDLNLLLCVLFLILETLQMISYAFSEPVYTINSNLWGLNTNTMDSLKKIITAVRLAPLLNAENVGFSLYVAIWGVMIAYVFFHTLVMAMAMRINKITSKFYQVIVTFTCYFTTPLSTFFLIPIAGIFFII
jgi:hypothetical protein